MKTITGIVNKIWQDRPDRYAISIGEDRLRLTGFGKCPFVEGQEATVTYNEVTQGDRVFRNIVGGNGKVKEIPEQIKKISEFTQSNEYNRARDRAIGCAVAIGSKTFNGKIKKNAEMIEHWINTGEWE